MSMSMVVVAIGTVNVTRVVIMVVVVIVVVIVVVVAMFVIMIVIVVVVVVSMSMPMIVIVVAIGTVNVPMVVSMSMSVIMSMIMPVIAIGAVHVMLLLCEAGSKFSEVRDRGTLETIILANGINDINIHGDDGVVRRGSAREGERSSSEVVEVGPSELGGTSLDGDFRIDGGVAEEHRKRLENGGEELFGEEGHEVDKRIGDAQLDELQTTIAIST